MKAQQYLVYSAEQMLEVTTVYYQRCLAQFGGVKYTFFKACNNVVVLRGRKCGPPTHMAFTLGCLQFQGITRKQKSRGRVEGSQTGGPDCP